MRRVVVTGIGLTTPLAQGREASWKRLVEGKSGIGNITTFEADDLPCRIAGYVPRNDGRGTLSGLEDDPHALDPDTVASKKERGRFSDFILYGLAAADEAVADSGWVADSEEDQYRSGVMIGSGIGGLDEIAENTLVLDKKGPRRISPFFIPGAISNLAAGQVSIRYGFKGPNHAVTTACATGAHAIGDATRLIKYGDADIMVAGGAEASICRIGIAGFAACKALSTGYNEHPETASRPYDEGRDGFVMGEGAGVVVLEELEHALARGAKIYAEISGYGLSGDAYHITSPAEDGDGGYRAMMAAMNDAGVKPQDIDYINAHGTSTPLGDEIEVRAIAKAFEGHTSNVSLSSTKSAIGHLLGAAGAVEAAFSLLAIRDNTVPPTLNLETPSFDSPIDLTPLKAAKRDIDVALSNSFGFGGTNAALIMKRYNG